MVSFTADLFDKSPSRWISLALFACYFFNYPVYLLQVAVSVNRFTALWMPIRHKKVILMNTINLIAKIFGVMGTELALDCGDFIHFLPLFDCSSFAIQCHFTTDPFHPSQTRVGLCPCHYKL
jgi:hypothetical protein